MMDTIAILALAAQCAPQVAPTTIAAIVVTESSGNPYAIGINSSAQLTRQPRDANEARRTAAHLLAQGHNIDMGLGQINSVNLEWLELDLRQVFDPCTNLAAAGRVLSTNFRDTSASERDPQQALLQAVSMYNTGSRSRGFRNGYVGKVQRNAARIAELLRRNDRPTRRASAEQSPAPLIAEPKRLPARRDKPLWSAFSLGE